MRVSDPFFRSVLCKKLKKRKKQKKSSDPFRKKTKKNVQIKKKRSDPFYARNLKKEKKEQTAIAPVTIGKPERQAR